MESVEDLVLERIGFNDIWLGNSTVLCITLHVGITKAIFEFLKFLMQFKCLRNGGWWWCVYPIEKCKVVYCTHLHSPFLRDVVGPVIVGAVWGVLESFVLQDTRQYCIKMFGCQWTTMFRCCTVYTAALKPCPCYVSLDFSIPLPIAFPFPGHQHVCLQAWHRVCATGCSTYHVVEGA